MKLAYIAGPYRGKSKIKWINWLQRQSNIRQATKVAKIAWKKGFVAVCPHLNSKNFDGLIPDQCFLEGAIEILKRCDVMFLVKGWEKSNGTLNELAIATQNNIPVYCDIPNVRIKSIDFEVETQE